MATVLRWMALDVRFHTTVLPKGSMLVTAISYPNIRRHRRDPRSAVNTSPDAIRVIIPATPAQYLTSLRQSAWKLSQLVQIRAPNGIALRHAMHKTLAGKDEPPVGVTCSIGRSRLSRLLGFTTNVAALIVVYLCACHL